MIYVACPSRYATGGVEFLHQACAELNKYMPARIWYVEGGVKPQPPEYDIYDNRHVFEIEPGSRVIYPEIWANMATQHDIILWESVDNFVSRFGQMELPGGILHLTQSEYARQYVKAFYSENIIPLTDYINADFFEPYEERIRHDYVLFNPAKGMKFTQRLMDVMPDITFVALQGLPRHRLINLMRMSKLYIDFGNHPGKDRLPREAAMCGCCVITGRDGSAAYHEDVGIPEQYKIERRESNIPMIASRIRETLRNFPERDFDRYRETVRGERERFEDGIKRVVRRLGGQA